MKVYFSKQHLFTWTQKPLFLFFVQIEIEGHKCDFQFNFLLFLRTLKIPSFSFLLLFSFFFLFSVVLFAKHHLPCNTWLSTSIQLNSNPGKPKLASKLFNVTFNEIIIKTTVKRWMWPFIFLLYMIQSNHIQYM